MNYFRLGFGLRNLLQTLDQFKKFLETTWRLLFDSQVSLIIIVLIEIPTKNIFQMTLIPNDDVISRNRKVCHRRTDVSQEILTSLLVGDAKMARRASDVPQHRNTPDYSGSASTDFQVPHGSPANLQAPPATTQQLPEPQPDHLLSLCKYPES